MKNKIVRCLIVVLGIIAILFALFKVLVPDKKLNTYLAIGDYLSVSGNLRGEEIVSFSSLLGDYFIENKYVSDFNDKYVSASVDSYMLLEMISKDANCGDGSSLVSSIKISKYITVSVGINDILKYIRYDSNNRKMIYDKETIKRKLEIMKQNYYEIIEGIKDLNNDVNVYLVGYYCPYEEGREVFDLLNESIKDVGDVTGVNFVDIGSVIENDCFVKNDDVYLNNKGHERVFDLLKQSYLHE